MAEGRVLNCGLTYVYICVNMHGIQVHTKFKRSTVHYVEVEWFVDHTCVTLHTHMLRDCECPLDYVQLLILTLCLYKESNIVYTSLISNGYLLCADM